MVLGKGDTWLNAPVTAPFYLCTLLKIVLFWWVDTEFITVLSSKRKEGNNINYKLICSS